MAKLHNLYQIKKDTEHVGKNGRVWVILRDGSQLLGMYHKEEAWLTCYRIMTEHSLCQTIESSDLGAVLDRNQLEHKLYKKLVLSSVKSQ